MIASTIFIIYLHYQLQTPSPIINMKYSIAILATLFANATLVVPTTADEVTESRIGDLKDKVQRLLEANELSYYDEKKLPKKFEELLNT